MSFLRTFTSERLKVSVTLVQSTANYTLNWDDPASARTLAINDPGGNDAFAFLAAQQTLTNKTLGGITLIGASDLGFSRESAGLLELNDGETGEWASLDLGNLTVEALNTVGTPTITETGTDDGATWGYKIVAKLADGTTTPASTEGTNDAHGPATLDGSDFMTITWSSVAGASAYDIYRTTVATSPTSTGLIATLDDGTLTLDDTGLAGDSSTAPSTDSTGVIKLAGNSFANIVQSADLTGNRKTLFPNADSNTVQPLGSQTSNSWVAYIDANGTQHVSQIDVSNLSGTLGVASGGTGDTSLTIHNVLIGEGTSSVGFAAPTATTGVPLVSNNATTDPSFGTASVAGGGTGAVTLTNHGVVIGQGTNAVHITSAGTTGQPLLSGGASADPDWGTLGQAFGGTGITSYTAGDILVANNSGTLVKLPLGSNGQVLTVNTSANPKIDWETGSDSDVATIVTITDADSPYTAVTSALKTLIKVNAAAGNVIVNLPVADSSAGKEIVVKRVDSSFPTHTVTIVADVVAPDSIDGAVNQVLELQWEAMGMTADTDDSWSIS